MTGTKSRPPGKPFPKGVSGNPKGGPKIAPELREFRKHSYNDFLDKMQLFGNLTSQEINKVIKNPKTIMFDKIFGRIVHDAAMGNKDARQVLLERLWGRVKNEVGIEVKNALKEELSMLSNEQLLRIAAGKNTEDSDD